MQTTQPAQVILIDDLDAMSLGTGIAIDALRAVADLLDTQPDAVADPRRLAAILHCIDRTARSGWPFDARR